MKTIKLVTKKEKLYGDNGVQQEVPINTILYIKTAVNNTPPGGFETSDMMNRLKISELLDKYERKKKLAKYYALKKQEEEETSKEGVPAEPVDEAISSEDTEVAVATKKEAKKKAKDEPKVNEDEIDLDHIRLRAEDYDGELKMEDALFERLGSYVKATKWAFVSQTIVDFENLFKKE